MRHWLLPLLFFSISTAFATEIFPALETNVYQPIDVQRVTASYWQNPKKYPDRSSEFHYRNTVDGNIRTSWGTGRKFDEKRGEWISFALEKPVFLAKIAVATGLQNTSFRNPRGAFDINGRPEEGILSFSDQYSQKRLTFQNELGFQVFEFSPVWARWARLDVWKIYPGKPIPVRTPQGMGLREDGDMGLAEVKFYTKNPLPLFSNTSQNPF